MQCFWFVLEEARCWEEKGRLGMALKRYGQVFKVRLPLALRSRRARARR